MFLLSKRAGALADRYGARWFMGGGGLLTACGLLLLLRVDADADYVTQLLPALLVFSVGLAATVAPLTATVLADADEEHAGIASGVNNAIARAAGLLGVAALGAVIAAQFTGSLDDRLAGVPLTPGGQAAVAEAKSRTLARADVSGLPAARGGADRPGDRGVRGLRVPHRHGDQRRARRPRRHPRPGAGALAAPRGQLRRLRRRPARGRPARRGARARAGRRARLSHVVIVTHPREVTDLILAAASSGH